MGTNPVSKAMLTYCQVDPKGADFSDISIEIRTFLLKKNAFEHVVENAFEHVVCKLVAILFLPRCVK